MTNQSGGDTTEQKQAAERIKEAKQLYRNINVTFRKILELIEDGTLDDAQLLPRQLAQLNLVVGDIQRKEADFNEKHGTGLEEGDIDFEDLRHQIGCRLRRIRKCCKS